ncbi:MAG: hypothetical protein M4579_006792 [Chaenotheca gracillima]|nr:MAG: hypothetical protein M4579_006792 [Chaenotheca gracillima]
MAGITTYAFVYVLGGLTFIPLVVLAVLIHAYFVFPIRSDDDDVSSSSSSEQKSSQAGSEEEILKTGTGGLLEKFNARTHEADVAAGYFAVCREYVPGGVNGKPPERITPAGAVIASESPSVYQSMYRSIFDRKQPPTLEPGKNGKKATNVFFVVLRLGHLMLYLDSEQVTLRHVFSLAHYNVGLHDGSNKKIPEGELWIKRNAICLTRKPHLRETNPDGTASHQLFLFSENCSEKEDFYFALLQNQERKPDALDNAPRPLHFDVNHLVSLVQRLHSSEEQLQTRWINAMIGRLFLAVYKTREAQELVRLKIKKKIARVKKPAFLSDIVLRKIDMGEGAPYITNPRLKDLTVDGNCAVEADVKYTGNFRIEIATTARIELGSRIKPREVNLVLAVVFKKLEGHGILRFKPPPSNRLWISFETMPKIEMTIEPIVSSRQITYGIILRQIESRIREVIAETVVLPHWDDIPFTETLSKAFRGGIWAPEEEPSTSTETTDEVIEDTSSKTTEDDKSVDESIKDEGPSETTLRSREKTMSMPAISPGPLSQKSRKATASTQSLDDTKETGSSTGIEAKKRSEKPKAVRAGSFAATSTPVISMDSTTVDAIKRQKINTEKDAASSMIEISHRSQPASPTETPVGSPPQTSGLAETIGSYSSASSNESNASDETTPQAQHSGMTKTPLPSSPASLGGGSNKSLHGFGNDPSRSSSISSLGRNMTNAEKKQSIASLGTAAKKWGWNVINKAHERQGSFEEGTGAPKEGSRQNPIGRGQPIPFALGKQNSDGASVAKALTSNLRRKPLPPPMLPQRPQEIKSRTESTTSDSGRSRSDPEAGDVGGDDDLLVVSAPADSGPTTPMEENREEFMHSMDMDEDEGDGGEGLPRTLSEREDHDEEDDASEKRPSLPSQQKSTSSLDQKDVLPSWVAAEEEAGSPKLWLDSENTNLS